MVTSPITITRLGRGRSPVFIAQWHDKPVEIRLDSSAVIKVQGDGDFDDIDHALAEASARISLAAQRLLEMRQIEPDDAGLVVVVSALDLD